MWRAAEDNYLFNWGNQQNLCLASGRPPEFLQRKIFSSDINIIFNIIRFRGIKQVVAYEMDLNNVLLYLFIVSLLDFMIIFSSATTQKISKTFPSFHLQQPAHRFSGLTILRCWLSTRRPTLEFVLSRRGEPYRVELSTKLREVFTMPGEAPH